jgi:predicted dehydrogenase
MPSLQKCDGFAFVGVATASESEWQGNASPESMAADRTKATNFIEKYGGRLFESYSALIDSPEIDCVYIPLPPALHFKWAKMALESGKHVFLEKPFTTSLSDTQELIGLARDRNLALHENYMFQYHSQIDWIREKLPELGDLRLIRLDFGFPFRGGSDFRYIKALGGGALLDCGGYPLKLASLLLGDTARVVSATLGYRDGIDVDICGNASMRNADGRNAQISFGMDNSYRCSLDIWGSKCSLYTNRIFTAPEGFPPTVAVSGTDGVKEYTLAPDDSFLKSIARFLACIENPAERENNYASIRKQAEILEQFKALSK